MTKNDWQGLSHIEAESFIENILRDCANIKKINIDIETGEYVPIVVPDEITSKYPGTLLALSVTSEALGRALIRDILERNLDKLIHWLTTDSGSMLLNQVYNQSTGYFIDKDGRRTDVYGFGFIVTACDKGAEFGFTVAPANVFIPDSTEGPGVDLPAISVFDFS